MNKVIVVISHSTKRERDVPDEGPQTSVMCWRHPHLTKGKDFPRLELESWWSTLKENVDELKSEGRKRGVNEGDEREPCHQSYVTEESSFG